MLTWLLTGCDSQDKELFNTVLEFDRAVRDGEISKIRSMMTLETRRLIINQFYENENQFYQELVNEAKKDKSFPKPKLKSVNKYNPEIFRVVVILGNGKKKSYYLEKEGGDWKITLVPQVKKLQNAEKQLFRK